MNATPPPVKKGLGFRASQVALRHPTLARRMMRQPVTTIDGTTLDPELEVVVASSRIFRQPFLGGGTERERRGRIKRAAKLAAAARQDIRVWTRQVDGADGPLDARWYRHRNDPGGGPGMVYFHGGGWVVGDLETHDAACRHLAAEAQTTVVSVDYRLAPEHVFPAAPHDAIAATRWVLAHAEQHDIDPERIGVGGDSAGGNLSAVVAQQLRDDDRAPSLQMLIYPGTTFAERMPSRDALHPVRADRCRYGLLHQYVRTRTHQSARAASLRGFCERGVSGGRRGCGFRPATRRGRRVRRQTPRRWRRSDPVRL
ncbi:MAG: alpha/beta hydrolase [Acidimicrobiia bacterium]|nr:alpha/beta hydrolase [Acidimicrobiia bacterium]